LVHAQNKIPVYIGYFTAWVDADGVVHFYEDVYKRDEALASLLISNPSKIQIVCIVRKKSEMHYRGFELIF
jgi:murein L,D-transpeptidase YcbB/YkuD